jgi:hypothetical protein
MLKITRLFKPIVSRSYTINPKDARMQIIKENREKQFKSELEQKLKDKKMREDERTSRKQENALIKAKEHKIKKESSDRLKKVVKEQKVSLAKKLAASKKSQWVRDQKDKEKVYVAQLRHKLKTKGKKPKDPKSPIRPRNAFVWFYGKNFSSISDSYKSRLATKDTPVENVKIPLGALMKEARSVFDRLSEVEKKDYIVLAQEDLARYQEERKKYVSHKKAISPHRVLTPYIRFFVDVRPSIVSENPKLKAVEIVKIIAGKWKGLSNEGKSKYVKAYEAEKNGLDVSDTE